VEVVVNSNLIILIATAIVLIGIGLSVGCCSTTDSISKTTTYTSTYSSTPSSTSAVTTAPTPETLKLSIGESAKSSDTIVTVTSVDRSESYRYYSTVFEKYMTQSAEPGKDYVLVDAELQYTGSSSDYVTAGSFSLADSEGYRYDYTMYYGDDDFPIVKELYPDQRVRGKLLYTVPSSAKGLKLYYNFGSVWTGAKLAYWQL